MYSLIFSSKLPKAKEFKRWVTAEVLPSLRKTGSYQLQDDMKLQFNLLNDKLKQNEEKIETLEAKLNNKDVEIYKINRKYERLKQRRTWHKFKVDFCLYIVINMNQLNKDFKFGITDNINTRLSTYRTNAPYTKILYLIYVSQHELVERLVKWEFKDSIQPLDHEFIIQRDYEEIVEKIEEIMRYLKIPYKVEENLQYYNRDIEDDFQNEISNRSQNSD